jgi:P27 family predicted phage terminase small subunit
MRGRKPIPTDIRKLMGTFNATVHGRDRKGEPKPEGDLPYDPPDNLTPSQAAIWRHAIENAPRGILKNIDLSVFLVWVTAFDEDERARLGQIKLDQRGGDLDFLMRNKTGEMVVSPYLRITDRCGQRMMKAASELGFTPSARPRLATGNDDHEEAPGWSRLQVIQGGRE